MTAQQKSCKLRPVTGKLALWPLGNVDGVRRQDEAIRANDYPQNENTGGSDVIPDCSGVHEQREPGQLWA